MTTRRWDAKWWKEQWMADHYGSLKSPKLLEGAMEYRDFTCTSLAAAVSYERGVDGSGKGVSRQMISYLVNGKVKTCEPDLAAAIERALDVPPHTIFDVLPKSSGRRQSAKADAA